MARQFGSYSPVWPLGTTLEEVLVFLDENGDPVDLTDVDVRAQYRLDEVLRDPDTGAGDTDPVLELVTDAGLYSTAPAWPLIVGFALGADPDAPDPTDGTIRLRIEAEDSWLLSPTNEKQKLPYDIEIIDPDDVIPLLEGRVTAKPRRTLGLPA
jgi:hypothetical protein